ncbi:MAG: NTP transferase domain-containing protein [Nitrospirales bacterium]|nr:NTP transferase domain-containing protein [Nitrospirales bacterium]
MKAMVLAAGLGTRLRPLTAVVPKPLLRVLDQPLILWNLFLLRRHHIVDVVINLHHLGKKVEDALGDGMEWGMRLCYSHEPRLLGTGGGIKQVESFFEGEPFLVLNGDTLIDINLTDLFTFHQSHQGLATMVLREDPDVEAWGVVETDERNQILTINGRGRSLQSSVAQRRRFMFAGVHVLNPLLLRDIPQEEMSSIIEAYFMWLEYGADIYGYVVSGYWSDIGTPDRLTQVRRDAKVGRITIPQGYEGDA